MSTELDKLGHLLGTAIAQSLDSKLAALPQPEKPDAPNIDVKVSPELVFPDATMELLGDILKQQDMTGVVEAITSVIEKLDVGIDVEALAEALTTRDFDSAPLVAAIEKIVAALKALPDVSTVLKESVREMKENTKAIASLERAFRAKKIVNYNGQGQAISIETVKS